MGDELFGADRTIPIEDRVDNAAKRVQKLSTSAKAAVGQTCRGLHPKRGREIRRMGSIYNGGRQDYKNNYNGDYDNMPRDHYIYGRGNGASGSYDKNRNDRETRPRTCFICGSPGIRSSSAPRATS